MSRDQRHLAAWFGLLLLAALASKPWAIRFLLADEPPAPSDVARTAKDEREEVLDSESWHKTLSGLDEWFSIQTIYDPQEAKQVKKQFIARLQKLPADKRDAIEQDLDAKLEMVLGPEGRDILGWVEANFAAAAPAYRKKLDLQYPDIMKLTAAQLREQLDQLERRRSAARNQSAALEQARQARIAALQADQRQQFDERERALDRGAASYGSSAYRSPYHPGGMRQYPDVVNRPTYGWGFGFW